MLTETRGLPMLVREYAEALRAAGQQDGGEAWSPPDSVRGLLGRRLRSASEPAAQMLSTAAVLGSGCDADLLRAVSGRGEAETVEALDEAVARFLLIELPPADGSGAPCYDFPYEALRRVAYESASLARRRLLHGRAADALAARYERDPLSVRAAVIAGHLQRAGREAESAGWWWRAAARARELYAHAEAHAHLRQALALGYPQVPGSIAAGDVLTVLGRYREALASYETAAAGSDGDHATSAAIEHKLAEVHHRLGDWALADAHLAAAADLLPARDLSGRARAGADRAVVAYRLGEHERAARLGGRRWPTPGGRPTRRPSPRPATCWACSRPGTRRRRGRGTPARQPGAGAAARRSRRRGGRAEQPGPAACRHRPGRMRPWPAPPRRWNWAVSLVISTGSRPCTPTWPTCCTRAGSRTRPWAI